MPAPKRSQLRSLELGPRSSRACEAESPVITGSDTGTITHQLISLCLNTFGPQPTPEQVLDSAGAISISGSIVHRQVLRMNSVTLAATYFREFVLGEAEFLGSEVWVGHVPVDLVWNRAGMIFIDEIKTGRTPAGVGIEAVEAQVREQWSCGSEEFGRAFGGVRAILLERVNASFHIDTAGRLLPVMPR